MSDSRTSLYPHPYFANLPAESSTISLRGAAEWLADTPIPASLFVAGTSTTATILAGGTPRISAILMVLAVTYASYAVDRIVDRANEGRGGASLGLAVAALALFALSFGLAYSLGGLPIAACAFFFPLSVAAYCLPWLGAVPALRARGILRVKDIPYTKNFYTAFCITLGGLWAALASGVTNPSQLLLAAGAMFVADFINTAACDLGDVEADRRNGVPTFAVLFGRFEMAQVLRGLAWTFYGSIALLSLLGLLPAIGLLISLGALPADAYLRALSKESTHPIFADLAPDLNDALVGLFALIFTMLVGG